MRNRLRRGCLNRMKENRKQRGFTLMEAMMAVFVLAVAASGISMAFAAAGTVQVEAQRRILASRLAANVIEKIVSVGYVQVKDVINKYKDPATPDELDVLGNFIDAVNPDPNSLVWSCEVKYGETDIPVVGDGGTVNLIQVTVAAKYNNQEITRLTTLIGGKNRH